MIAASAFSCSSRKETSRQAETDSTALPKDTIFIRLEKSEYSASDTIINYTLENYTDMQVYGGGSMSYDFDKLVDGKWVGVTPATNIGESLVGYIFKDTVTKQTAMLYPLYRMSKGHYRLRKEVEVGHTILAEPRQLTDGRRMTLCAEFDIIDDINLWTKVSKTKLGINIDIMESRQRLQSIDYRYDTEFESNQSSRRDSVVLRDVTFDGHDDLLIYLGSFGNQGVEYFDCYVWNDGNRKFVHAPTFKDIQNPTAANGCIYSKARESASTYIYERWTYGKGRFSATARLVERYSADRSCLYDEYLIGEKQQKKNLTCEQISKFWMNVVGAK